MKIKINTNRVEMELHMNVNVNRLDALEVIRWNKRNFYFLSVSLSCGIHIHNLTLITFDSTLLHMIWKLCSAMRKMIRKEMKMKWECLEFSKVLMTSFSPEDVRQIVLGFVVSHYMLSIRDIWLVCLWTQTHKNIHPEHSGEKEEFSGNVMASNNNNNDTNYEHPAWGNIAYSSK